MSAGYGEYPKGAEWRRWDLQIHTPFSTLNNEFGDDFDVYAKAMLKRALSSNIAVIGVTDYFTIEGYKKLRSLLSDRKRLTALLGDDAPRAAQIRLLPNIELRTSIIIVRADNSGHRVNFHILFSDELQPETIEEDFLARLRFTALSSPNADERWALTTRNLELLGGRLKRDHDEFRNHSDRYVGMMQAVVSHEEVTEVLNEQRSRFKDQYLIILPADEDLSACSWDGQAHLARKLLLQKSHMLFSANASTKEFALGGRHPSLQDYTREFGMRKACVHGSDAHSYDALFKPAGNRFLWIKADPTFQGLRQLLHEPETRVYIGEEPPALARGRELATKYMECLEFVREPSALNEFNWFSGRVPLNPGLVAVIGNKGSGKSALADILALLGNTRQGSHFSFLSKGRFLDQKTDYGKMFSAKLTWCSSKSVRRSLASPPDKNAPELIKYIPQNYLETICTELRSSDESEFDLELMNVIFSHVSNADRLGKNTLSELLRYLTGERQKAIELLVTELQQLNLEIAQLNRELTPDHRATVEAELAQKNAELDAHLNARPAEVQKPDDQALLAHSQTARTALALLNERAEEIDRQIRAAEETLVDTARRLAAADRVLARVTNFERQYSLFARESAEDLQLLSLGIDDLATLRIDRGRVDEARQLAADLDSKAKLSLDQNDAASLRSKRSALQREIEVKAMEVDEPTQRYEAFRVSLTDWEIRRDNLVGSGWLPGSLEGIRARLRRLDDAPGVLSNARAARAEKMREIFEVKARLLADYHRLYSPVQSFIDNHPVSREHGGLQFSATMAVTANVQQFLDMIHQGRKGSFQGEREGRDLLNDLVASSDFSTAHGVGEFLGRVEEHLGRDHGTPSRDRVKLSDQLVQGAETHDVYDFLYGLSYLQPRFELRWQGKTLDQLSPGERGNLLLVFYLLIDKGDSPLIIDQPEENLDNQTIAKTLVPAIRHAKDRRQIVLVTHNPNLAVVCDADQVIYARTDKSARPWIAYESGAIEDPRITQRIVDVLEGTKPAFDLRDARYEVLEVLPSV